MYMLIELPDSYNCIEFMQSMIDFVTAGVVLDLVQMFKINLRSGNGTNELRLISKLVRTLYSMSWRGVVIWRQIRIVSEIESPWET